MPTTILSDQHRDFQDRIRRIEKAHAKMAHGVVFKLGSDGVIRPEGQKQKRSFVALRAMLIVLVVFFLLKGVMLRSMGEPAYGGRLALLEAGTALEKAGAVVMAPDAATVWLAGTLGRLLP